MKKALAVLILSLIVLSALFAVDPRLSAMADVGIGVSGSNMQSYRNPAAVFFDEPKYTFAIRGRLSDTLGVSSMPYLPQSDVNALFVADLIAMGIDLSFRSDNFRDDTGNVDLYQHTTLNVSLGYGYRFISVGLGIFGGSSQQRLNVPMQRIVDFPIQSIFAPYDRVVNSEYIQVDAGLMLKFGQFSAGVLLDNVLDKDGAQTTFSWRSLFADTGIGLYWERNEYSSRGRANQLIYSVALEANGLFNAPVRTFKAASEIKLRLVRDSSISVRGGYKALFSDMGHGEITAGIGLVIRKLEFALNAEIPVGGPVSMDAFMTVLF
ncbi:MAG: hypothetical protein J6X41_03545 [Spirochaetales bacterium]|nr:hypothetical protein [Spirochaetales bacterium]